MATFILGYIAGMVITFFGNSFFHGRKSGPEKLMWR